MFVFTWPYCRLYNFEDCFHSLNSFLTFDSRPILTVDEGLGSLKGKKVHRFHEQPSIEQKS